MFDENRPRNKADKRIGEIQTHTEPVQWLHVATKENPADKLTRGVGASAISADHLWWHGPGFLQLVESEWPEQKILGQQREDPERRRGMTESMTFTTLAKTDVLVFCLDRACLDKIGLSPGLYSNWIHLIWCLVMFIVALATHGSQRVCV